MLFQIEGENYRLTIPHIQDMERLYAISLLYQYPLFEYWGRFVYVLDGSGIDYVCASVKCLAKRSTKLVFRKYPHERCCFMEKQGFSFVPALVPLDAEKQDIHWEMEKEFF